MNDRRYKRYDFPIDFLLTCISLNMKFSIPTKNLLSFSHFLAFFINHLVWRTKKCRFIWSSDRLEPELRHRCSWEKLVTVADFKRLCIRCLAHCSSICCESGSQPPVGMVRCKLFVEKQCQDASPTDRSLQIRFWLNFERFWRYYTSLY